MPRVGHIATQLPEQAVERRLAKSGRGRRVLGPRQTSAVASVGHLRAGVSEGPIDADVVRLLRLARRVVRGHAPDPRVIHAVRCGQALVQRVLVLQPAAHGAREMTVVVEVPERQALEVHRLQEMAEERALDAEHVPPADLVAAGHRAQALALQETVPGLRRRVELDRQRALAVLDLGSQHALLLRRERWSVVPAVRVLRGSAFLVPRGEQRAVAARGRADVQVEGDASAQAQSPRVRLLGEDGRLAGEEAARFFVEQPQQASPRDDLRVRVVHLPALEAHPLSRDATVPGAEAHDAPAVHVVRLHHDARDYLPAGERRGDRGRKAGEQLVAQGCHAVEMSPGTVLRDRW